MKTLNDYMAMSYRMEIVEDKDEGGFVVSYPDLPGCITCGETVESAVANALDAKKAWIEAALEEGVEIHDRHPECWPRADRPQRVSGVALHEAVRTVRVYNFSGSRNGNVSFVGSFRCTDGCYGAH